MRIVAVVLKKKTDPQPFAEICWRYTPEIALGEHWFFLNIEGCQNLYSEQTLLLRLQAHGKKRSQLIRWAVAEDPATALAFAFFRQRERFHLPLAALPFYFNPYKIEFQDKVLRSLSRLGARTLSDVMRMPRTSLLRRFGPEILLALDRLSLTTDFPWPRLAAPLKVEEVVAIDSSFRIQTVEPLIFLLTPILDSALQRLKARGQALLHFQIVLLQESSSVVEQARYEFTFELSAPHHRSKPLVPIIRDRIERGLLQNPVKSALHEMRLEVLTTAPLRSSQADLMRAQEEQMQESLQSLVLRLRERLGPQKVFFAQILASHVPEKTWEKSSQVTSAQRTSEAHRPLRLLRTPLLLGREGVLLSCAHRQWRVVDMQGPERIQTEWWAQEVQRDYYLVHTEEGEKLWIYVSLENGLHYLHGVFD